MNVADIENIIAALESEDYKIKGEKYDDTLESICEW
jgi:hypothetical protein